MIIKLVAVATQCQLKEKRTSSLKDDYDNEYGT